MAVGLKPRSTSLRSDKLLLSPPTVYAKDRRNHPRTVTKANNDSGQRRYAYASIWRESCAKPRPALPMCRTRCVRPPTASARYASPLSGALAYVAERVGFTRAIHGPRPSGSFAVHIGSPADVSNSVSSSTHRFRQIRKSPQLGALAYLAEAVRFELTVDANPRQFSRLLP